MIIEIDLLIPSPAAKSLAITQRSGDVDRVMLEAAATVDRCPASDPVLRPAKQAPPCSPHRALLDVRVRHSLPAMLARVVVVLAHPCLVSAMRASDFDVCHC